MIVEHEVIEQIEEQVQGRSLDWVCTFLRDLGRDDPLVVLCEMSRAGYVTLVDDAGQPLPDWRRVELFREGAVPVPVQVRATAFGSRWVHG